MPVLKQQVFRLIALVQRHPGVVAIFGFVSGLASFLLVERQAELAQVLALVMLVSWLWLILENVLRERIAHWFGFELPPPLLRYATQMIHQESLFFVLPFFFITTTWNSGQLLFSGLLASAALISIIDPLYYKWLAPRRWLFLAFHTLALFALLLTALPIIFKLTTAQSYPLALAAAKRAVEQGWDLGAPEPERQFFYLPFEHSEALEDQDRAVELIGERLPEGGAETLLHARAHREIIRQFGRFPFRNAALGRLSSPQEAAFLAEGGYGAIVERLKAEAMH